MRQGDRAFARSPDRHRRLAQFDLVAEQHAADDDQTRTGLGLLRRGGIQHGCAISLEILVLDQGPDSQRWLHCSPIESRAGLERFRLRGATATNRLFSLLSSGSDTFTMRSLI